MLTALVLICSLATTPDLASCTRDNAVDVLRVPESFGNPAMCFMHGQAYLAVHRGPEAATEFQKIIDHIGVVSNDPTIVVAARLQLARALALSGHRDKAKSAYQDFLKLWKDADPDIPILQQANAERAKVQ